MPCALAASPDGELTVAAEGAVHHFASVAAAIQAGVLADRRLVWWSAAAHRDLIAEYDVTRCWDLAAVHRLVAGGSRNDPAAIWALSQGLPVPEVTRARDEPDLFADATSPGPEPGRQLASEAGGATWLRDRAHRERWAAAALEVFAWQADQLTDRVGELACAYSESGAAMLCIELEQHGLPVDVDDLQRHITTAAGPRPVTAEEAAQYRRERDSVVWQHVPGGRPVDLRNPAAVREMLRQAGVVVEDTRAWHLEPYRAGSPLVDALLTWRKAERLATTYGWHWLDTYVGADHRLRGGWDASDGGAGRMTAGSGLHSLPTPLRSAVAADPGHVLVRADLGQIEPRVLAVVAKDPGLAAATRADDLYLSIGAGLGVERPTAKIAMLAAMYGQTSGTAGQVLDRLERAYPVAMEYLRTAATSGEQGRDVVTYGGRRVRVSSSPDDTVAMARGRGRFTRNAVVQGAAAEFFKAWALTVRAAITPLGGRIVLCLHDELLVHTPAAQADSTAQAVNDALQAAARRWSRGAPVRFVTDTSIVRRWSEAKD